MPLARGTGKAAASNMLPSALGAFIGQQDEGDDQDPMNWYARPGRRFKPCQNVSGARLRPLGEADPPKRLDPKSRPAGFLRRRRSLLVWLKNSENAA